MKKVRVKIKQTDKGLPLPNYATGGSVACDLHSAEDVVLKKGEFKAIDTGIKVALPPGYELNIRARSGLAAKHGISMANGVGTLDWDYRGPVKAILINHGPEDFVIKKGDRIAQMVLNKVELIDWEVTEELEETGRNEGGLGHTGV